MSATKQRADKPADPRLHSATSGAGPALFQLVRFWSRRWVTDASRNLPGETGQVRHVLTVEAVHAGESAAGHATVNTIAHQLGLDHSGASRMVREAAKAGYLTRTSSDHDRRRASLQLTDHGQRLLKGSHHWQQQTFERLTADWADHDRDQFASYLERLAKQLDLDNS